MPTLTYCINTFNSFDRCVQAIHAVMKNTTRPDWLIVIDDSGTGAALEKIVPVLTEYYQNGFTNILVWVHDRQCGVSTCWNQFLRDTVTDYVLIANDDVMPHPQTIARMLERAAELPEEVFFAGDGYSGNSFSFFMVPRERIIEKIGFFDEAFFPSYFEDNDYSRRITLAKFKHVIIDGATYDHVGSSTLHNYTPEQKQLHHMNFERNREYFKSKWGGMPGEEIYHVPWNGAV